jgi:hypothetical protein
MIRLGHRLVDFVLYNVTAQSSSGAHPKRRHHGIRAFRFGRRVRAVVVAAAVFLLGLGLVSAWAQQPPSPPPTAEELKAYETFRAWLGSQPAEVQKAEDAVVFQRYADLLKSQGQSAQQAASTIDLLRILGDRAEIERWNRILTAPKPAFNTSPNAFLAAMTAGVKPGRSLDVGMGQGGTRFTWRNRVGTPWDSIQPIGR